MESENLKDELNYRVSALKKQTTAYLIGIILCLIYAVYISYKIKGLNTVLKDNNIKLNNAQKSLTAARDSLKKVSEKYASFNTQILSEKKEEKEIDLIKQINNLDAYQLKKTVQDKNIIREIKTDLIKTQKFSDKVIFIQDRKGSLLSDAIKARLKEEGFTVPRIETIGTKMRFNNSVKYFKTEDRPLALSIQKLVYAVVNKEKIKVDSIRVFFLDNKSVPKGQFEIWVDK